MGKKASSMPSSMRSGHSARPNSVGRPSVWSTSFRRISVISVRGIFVGRIFARRMSVRLPALQPDQEGVRVYCRRFELAVRSERGAVLRANGPAR
jgi:hypothetical protein